jgi:hypothetical protein
VAAVLKRRGLVTKEYRDRLTKKHMKRYRRPFPGYMQLDIKYTPYLLEGLQYYQISAVDHHSSWRLIRSYPDKSVESVLKFLNELERQVPFGIIQIQTDNDAAFTDKFTSQGGSHPTSYHLFDRWCSQRGIEHKLIPLMQKEINGKVENTHKFDDREFYSQIEVHNLIELQLATIEHNRVWNDERATKTLGWKTPIEVVHKAYVRAIAYLKLMLPRSAWQTKPIHTLPLSYSDVRAPKPELERIQKLVNPNRKIKQPSLVDRYLQYLDWEEKQKLKTWLPVPMILQNFSRESRGLSDSHPNG